MRKLLIFSVVVNIISLSMIGHYVFTRHIFRPQWWWGNESDLRYDIFSACPASDGRIIMIGDSNTFRPEWDELFGVDVLNRGVDGETTKKVAARLPELLRHHPRLAVINVGLNDVAGHIPTEESIDRYRLIIEGLKAGGSRVVMVSVLPVDTRLRASRNNYRNADVRVLNERLRLLAEETGSEYLNIHSEFLNDEDQLAAPYHNGDGTHLSPAGYQKLADFIRPHL